MWVWVAEHAEESAKSLQTFAATGRRRYFLENRTQGGPIGRGGDTHPRVRSWIVSTACTLGLSTLLGCTAQVGEEPTGAPPRGSGGSSGSGAGGSAASSGSGGVATAATDPGRVTLRRLNRAEYDNTVRDLLGTTQTPSVDFPIDDRGSGFDNMADVLTLSPLHLSTYHTAAKALVSEALTNASQRAKLLTCDLNAQGEACAEQALRGFAYRAWRRPIADAELTRLMDLVRVAGSNGDSVEQGLALALRATLLSPHFLFRVELDADPTSLTPHPLGAYELASRLSYFLWSSAPDAALLQSAESGSLATSTTLREQAARMLQDERAQALVENFAGQWLHLRAVEALEPDRALFPSVNAPLLAAMKRETERLFQDIAFSAVPLRQLLTANFSYVSDELAAHYGLAGNFTSELTRVDLSASPERGGLLTHGAFLSLTSHVNRTSPVVRGKWVMDELLCATVPPPPVDVNLNGVSMAKEQGLTQRQALEIHRQDPKCFGCHQLMDPIGLGLENYDAIGRFRTTDGELAIDASGQLPSGEAFVGAKELAERIAANPELARCVAKKLYTYALGRPPVDAPDHLDVPTLDALATSLAENGSFSELLGSIVTSAPFTQRRGEAAGGMP